MSKKIKNEDINENKKLTAEEMEQVKGGPNRRKIDGGSFYSQQEIFPKVETTDARKPK